MSYRETPPRRNILPNETRRIDAAQARERISFAQDFPTRSNETGSRPVKKGLLALVSALLHLGRI